ncbi:MAG: hypothetical protein DFNUSKGM_000269 [Candidatus Fervidibacter sacchari]
MMLLPSRKRQRMASSELRMVFLEGSAPGLPKNFVALEGSAPALPSKISVVLEHEPPVKNSQTLNEFGATRIRHQPLA